MKTLDPAIITAFESTSYRQAVLLGIEVSGYNLKFTDWDHKLFFSGDKYVPRGMSIKSINYGESNIVSSLSLVLDDVDRGMYETFGELGPGRYPVKLRISVLDELGVILGAYVAFSGFASQWEYTPGSLRLKVSSIFDQWGRVTISRFSASCRWKVFRGNECKYPGPGAECDRTYSQCVAYENIDNFGGFRWLPSLVNRNIPGQ